jgi:hypothetical protein
MRLILAKPYRLGALTHNSSSARLFGESRRSNPTNQLLTRAASQWFILPAKPFTDVSHF